ncbi:ciliary microtubule-associated protein 2 [Sarcoramphus papa]
MARAATVPAAPRDQSCQHGAAGTPPGHGQPVSGWEHPRVEEWDLSCSCRRSLAPSRCSANTEHGGGKASASGWARAEKGSWLSKLPHFQFKEIMKRRKRQQERLGPGTYNIRDFLQETRPSSLRGICDTREQRFRDAHRDCFPGPGTYGPRGNPYVCLEERDKQSASTRGLMDSRTAKCALPAAGSGLGPGTYHLQSSIDEGLRRAGGSGPCQPISGDRSKPAGGGHHALELRHCQHIAIRIESCLTPASVPLGFCSLASLGSWKNMPTQQCLGSERAAGTVQESGLVPRRGTELSTGTVKGFLDELTLKENKKKGCFSTLPRNPGCPTERIFWATLSQCPREACAVGPGSYNPKPVEGSACSSQPPFWSSAKRFDRKSYRLFTGNEQHQQHVAEPMQNPVGVGRYDITKHEKYPQKMRYQSLYRCDAQRYLSNLKQDAYLLERLKPVAKISWSDLVSATPCPDTSEEITVFQTSDETREKVKWSCVSGDKGWPYKSTRGKQRRKEVSQEKCLGSDVGELQKYRWGNQKRTVKCSPQEKAQELLSGKRALEEDAPAVTKGEAGIPPTKPTELLRKHFSRKQKMWM